MTGKTKVIFPLILGHPKEFDGRSEGLGFGVIEVKNHTPLSVKEYDLNSGKKLRDIKS